MYNGIGGKIKGIAVISAIIAVSACCVTGIVLMALHEDLMALGLLVMLIGSFLAWVSSWLLYGVGQLIENSDIIAEPYRRKNTRNEEQKIKSENKKETIKEFEIDESEYIDISCPNCKEKLSYTKEQLQNSKYLTCPICDAPIFLR